MGLREESALSLLLPCPCAHDSVLGYQFSLYARAHMLRAPIGLSLAAPGRTAVGRSVGAGTCGNTISKRSADPACGKAPAGFTNSRYLLVLHLHQRACSPAAALRHRLLVRGEVEGEEEEQVRRDDADAGNGGEFLAGAFAHVGQARPVRASKVGVGREVDAAWKLLVLDVKCVIAGTYRGRCRIG